MKHYDDLDQDILSLQKSAGTPVQAGIFLHALRKLAAPGEPAPDQNLATHAKAVAEGDEASPADAEALYQAGQPDTAGHLEGEFAVPLEQAVMTMAQLVSHELKLQLAYVFYAEMLRGLNRDLAEVFDHIAGQELEDAKYLLRRISVLMPGGVQIPIPPSPTPLADPIQILHQMIAGEQQAIVMLKALHSQMGENPMKYTVEQMLSEEQEHLDKLWQFMPAGVPSQQPALPGAEAQVAPEQAQPAPEQAAPPPEGGPASGKVAAAIKTARRKLAEVAAGGVVPPPGSEPVEATMQREHQLSLAQSEAEKQDLMARLAESQQMVEQHMAAADQANQAAQQASEQASMASQTAAAQQQAAQDAQTAATQAQAQAAAEAEGKMRLSIRLSQIRQQIANIASQDPAAEEGMGAAGPAGAGSVATAPQQQAAAQEQAMQEMAQQQMAAEQQGGPKAKKETAQAQRAQQEAQIQGHQAAVSQATGA